MAETGQLHDWNDMEGKTVRVVIQTPTGRYGCNADVVIVFDDNTWAALRAMPDGSESAYLELNSRYGFCGHLGATDFLHPEELLTAGLVNEAQRDYLLAKEATEENARKAKRRDQLLAEAEKLAREIDGNAA